MKAALALLLPAALATACASASAPTSAYGPCRPVRGQAMPGPEDFAVEYDGRRPVRLLVSVNDRRREDDTSRNGIYEVPLENGRPGVPRKLAIEGCPHARCAAKPHGISLVREQAEGALVLWAINHGPGPCSADDEEECPPEAIERYAVEGDSLRFLYELPRDDDLLRKPNDLVGLPDGTLFVTNLSHHRARTLQLLDFVWPTGSVIRYRNGVWSVVDAHYRAANGIAVTKDESDAEAPPVLHVAELFDEEIHLFEIREGHALSPRGRIELASMPDNLLVDPDGRIWIAAHPSMWAFLRHSGDPLRSSPTDVFVIDAPGIAPRRTFGAKGPTPNAGSTAIAFGQSPEDTWLYVGQVFDDGIVACGPWDANGP